MVNQRQRKKQRQQQQQQQQQQKQGEQQQQRKQQEQQAIKTKEYLKFSQKSINLEKNLATANKYINKVKNFFIILFFITILWVSFFKKINIEEITHVNLILPKEPEDIFILIFSFSIYYIMNSEIKQFIYSYILKKGTYNKDSFTKKQKFLMILKNKIFLISSDISLSSYYKNKLLYRYHNDSPKDTYFFIFEENQYKISLKDFIFEENKIPLKDFILKKKQYKIPLNVWKDIQVERKFFIQTSNWLNICLTSFLSIITLISFFHPVIPLSILIIFFIFGFVNNGNPFKKLSLIKLIVFIVLIVLIVLMFVWLTNIPDLISAPQIFIYILLIRFFSRAIEIILSFYKDVASVKSLIIYENLEQKVKFINNLKYSLIRSPGRLSLAIHSLIEFAILCSTIYFILDMLTTIKDNEHMFVSLYESFLYSASIGVFNVSFDDKKILLWESVHVTQIFVSVVLILLSIAQYLGNDKELTSEEEKFYREISPNKTEV